MESPVSHWPPPPPGWSLASRAIQVWCFSLERSPTTLQPLGRLLSPDEADRAERFHFDRDRRRFIVAHGLLRRILSQYVGGPPERLEYAYGPQGKPTLRDPGGRLRLHFNLAHSEALGLCAVALDRALGVDLEWIRPLADLDQIASRFFSALENEQLRALPEPQRLPAFFRCWTRKEAFLKAGGEGLTRPLDSFAVSLAPGQPAQFLHIEGSASQAADWSLHSLTPAPGYVGAVAVPGRGWGVQCWRWPEAEETRDGAEVV